MLKTCARIECQLGYSNPGVGLYCFQCKELENRAFYILRDFVREYPTATVIEIYQATEIPLDIIKKLLQSGRLTLIRRCTRCQAELGAASGGALCQVCAKKIQNELVSKLSHPPVAVRRMHLRA